MYSLNKKVLDLETDAKYNDLNEQITRLNEENCYLRHKVSGLEGAIMDDARANNHAYLQVINPGLAHCVITLQNRLNEVHQQCKKDMADMEASHGMALRQLERKHEAELRSFKSFEKFTEWKELLAKNSSLEAENKDYKQLMEQFKDLMQFANPKAKDLLKHYHNLTESYKSRIAKQQERIAELESQIGERQSLQRGTQRASEA